jgi:hypothetical protein
VRAIYPVFPTCACAQAGELELIVPPCFVPVGRLTYAHLFTLSSTIASPPLPTSAELVDGYLALGPIPNGKRCLLVTGPSRACPCPDARSRAAALFRAPTLIASSALPLLSTRSAGGTNAPTTLHTRVSARVLLRWVAPLPGGTVLDCLLPNEWKTTGVLYVLDCLRWKDLDIAASGASLRQFFLHSRLAELPPPQFAPRPDDKGSASFKHPTLFLPVPSSGPPISPAQWSTLRTAGLQAGEGVMILGAESSYVTGAERDVGEAWWVGPDEVDNLLAYVPSVLSCPPPPRSANVE